MAGKSKLPRDSTGTAAEEVTARNRAAKDSAQYRHLPEKSVRGRAPELTAANEQLQLEIAERRRAEEALRESEERYRALFEYTTEGILVADIETRVFKYANPAICRMLGYSEGELTLMCVSDIHPKESLAYAYGRVQELVAYVFGWTFYI